MAKELTLTLIETGQLVSEDLNGMLQKTHAMLTALKTQEDSGAMASAQVAKSAPIHWRRSITKHAVTCLECGESFKQLSVRHLQTHGLDGSSYRAKYHIPRSQPLAARQTTAKRREVAQVTRPWEKAPTFQKGHEPAKQEARPAEVAKAPSQTVKASSQSKQQRKTSPKKTERKKSG